MIRFFAFLVGFFFLLMSGCAMVADIQTYYNDPPAPTADSKFHKDPDAHAFASDGAFGNFDKVQLQRGLKVYQEVCAACHSLNYVSFRNFEALGYDKDQVKNLAAAWPIPQPSINGNTGEADTRPNLPSDPLPPPFANDQAAKAGNNGAVPPDLSLITKARAGGGPYIRSLLLGYQAPSKALAEEFPDSVPGDGLHHNPYFYGLNIAMAEPITDGIANSFTYDDGTSATKEQMATDVAAFLIWTAEPKLVERRQLGWAVIGFLLILTVLAYLSYRTIWADLKKKD